MSDRIDELEHAIHLMLLCPEPERAAQLCLSCRSTGARLLAESKVPGRRGAAEYIFKGMVGSTPATSGDGS